ncbi:hypothetical protein J2Y63_003761 [Shinella sp. BE166]|uniref:DUF4376 domain-containing protein n=1 Tax=Shinella sp. BE166 TaxID=3373918 RepID=UPI003EBF2FD1
MDYQRIILSGPTIDGESGVPDALVGLSDESLADLSAALDPCPAEYVGVGYWPIQPADPTPDGKVAIDRHVELFGGLPQWVDELEDAPPPTGDQINAERDRRISAGATFAVPGYGDVPLTGRVRDQTVLLALLVKAQGAKAAGITAPVMVIRDGADANHILTPDQMISLVSSGMNWIEATMQRSWDMKDGVSPFEDGPPLDFTDDAYWP